MSIMEKFLFHLFEISLTMSIIILLFAAFNVFFAKKYAAKWRYIIWIILLVALLIPFRPDFDFSLTNTLHPLEETNAEERNLTLTENISNETSEQVALPVNKTPKETGFMNTTTLLLFIWLGGVALFLVYMLWMHIRFLRMVKRWRYKIKDQTILAILQEEKERMGAGHKKIALYGCKLEISPMLIYQSKPTILLPHKEISQEELSYIFRHELIHYRRKDIWIRYLMLFINAIYWFNPVIYFMAKSLQNECEESCDEKIVRGLDTLSRKEYGETIIGIIGREKITKTRLSTNFYGGKKTMKKRLSTIMDTSKKKVGIALVASVLTVSAIAISGSIWINGNDSRAEAAADLTSAQAKKIALKEAGGGKVVKYQLDTEKGRKIYEIEVINGNTKYSFDIGVKDSRIYSYEEKAIISTTTSAKKTNEITAQEAGRIAVQKAGGGKVISSKLDYDDGKKVYDVEVQNGNVKHEVQVGAIDSKIYQYEKETVKTASNSKPNTQANTKAAKKETTPNTAMAKKPASDISLANAQQIALSKTGGGRVVSAYADYDDGHKEYDFKIINGNTEYELEIGASDSKVYKFEKEVMAASNKNQTPRAPSGQTKSQTNPPANDTQSNGISLARAQQIALSKTGGGRVVSSSVDYDDGRKEYEFDIVKGNMEYDVTVGADSQIYDFDQDTVDFDD